MSWFDDAHRAMRKAVQSAMDKLEESDIIDDPSIQSDWQSDNDGFIKFTYVVKVRKPKNYKEK